MEFKKNIYTVYALMILLSIFSILSSCQISEGINDTVNGEWYTHKANDPNRIIFGKSTFTVLAGDSLDNEIVKGEEWSTDDSIITIKNVKMKKADGSWSPVFPVLYANYKFEDHTLLLNMPIDDMAALPANFYGASRLERSDVLDLKLTAVSINGQQVRSKEKVTVPPGRLLLPVYRTTGFRKSSNRVKISLEYLSTSGRPVLSSEWDTDTNFGYLSDGSDFFEITIDKKNPEVFKKISQLDSGQWQITFELFDGAKIVQKKSFWFIIEVESLS